MAAVTTFTKEQISSRQAMQQAYAKKALEGKENTHCVLMPTFTWDKAKKTWVPSKETVTPSVNNPEWGYVMIYGKNFDSGAVTLSTIGMNGLSAGMRDLCGGNEDRKLVSSILSKSIAFLTEHFGAPDIIDGRIHSVYSLEPSRPEDADREKYFHSQKAREMELEALTVNADGEAVPFYTRRVYDVAITFTDTDKAFMAENGISTKPFLVVNKHKINLTLAAALLEK